MKHTLTDLPPCKPGQTILVRNKIYLVKALEPIVIKLNQRFQNGQSYRFDAAIPQKGEMYYIQRIITVNDFAWTLNRPEGRPRFVPTREITPIESALSDQYIQFFMTMMPGDTLSINTTVNTATTFVNGTFYMLGYHLYLEDSTDTKAQIELPDTVF